MKRKLVAALACRNEGTRLYGKPLQNIDISNNLRIIDIIIKTLNSISEIDDIILGISNSDQNLIYKKIAKENKIKYIMGDQIDVLSRLIKCGKKTSATDIFRITTESPFLYYENINKVWSNHIFEDLDFSSVSTVDGTGFEIIKLDALIRSHKEGNKKHKSELCSLYIRENQKKFKICYFKPSSKLCRKDLRLTVDYPEDLIICRAVFEKFKKDFPLFKISKIIKYLDQNSYLKKLTKKVITN